MPSRDGTGPMGIVPLTGRGLGPCKVGKVGFVRSSMGRGQVWGRGLCGRWFWNRSQTLESPKKKELLEQELKYLKQEIENVQNELDSLKK